MHLVIDARSLKAIRTCKVRQQQCGDKPRANMTISRPNSHSFRHGFAPPPLQNRLAYRCSACT